MTKTIDKFYDKMVYYCAECSHIEVSWRELERKRCCPDMQAFLVPEETALQAKLGFAHQYLRHDAIVDAIEALQRFNKK